MILIKSILAFKSYFVMKNILQKIPFLMRAVALQRLMGHTDITITLNTYTSIFNKYKLEEIEKVNDYFINNNILNNRSTFQIGDGKNQENDLEITR